MLPGLDAASLRREFLRMFRRAMSNGGAATARGALGSSTVGDAVFTAANTAAARDAIAAGALSWRNKIRNPKMEIARRGTNIAGFAAGNAYSLDGWQWISTCTAVATISQQNDTISTANYQYSLRVTVTTADAAVAAGDVAYIRQPIEGFLIRDLVGNPVAVRFDVRSAKTGTHCVALSNGNGDRSYVWTYNVAAANTWQTVTLSLPGGLITAGTWNYTNGAGLYLVFVLMAGSNYNTATANTWGTGFVPATSAQVNVLDTVDNIFAIGGVQLERGSVSTPLEHRDPATELLFNQRYYQIVTATAAGYASAGGQYIAAGVTFAPMRTVPSYGLSGGSSANVGSETANIAGVNSLRYGINSAAAGQTTMNERVFTLTAEL